MNNRRCKNQARSAQPRTSSPAACRRPVPARNHCAGRAGGPPAKSYGQASSGCFNHGSTSRSSSLPLSGNQCVANTQQPVCVLCGFGNRNAEALEFPLEVQSGSKGRRGRLAEDVPVFHGKPAELPETILCRDVGYVCDVRIGFLQSAAHSPQTAQHDILIGAYPKLFLASYSQSPVANTNFPAYFRHL
jgi:hypothetical protein